MVLTPVGPRTVAEQLAKAWCVPSEDTEVVEGMRSTESKAVRPTPCVYVCLCVRNKKANTLCARMCVCV